MHLTITKKVIEIVQFVNVKCTYYAGNRVECFSFKYMILFLIIGILVANSATNSYVENTFKSPNNSMRAHAVDSHNNPW